MCGVEFAADGRLATASGGKVRLYDRDFKLVGPLRKASGGDQPCTTAFSPDGKMLAVGYSDAVTVDLFDGHSLARLVTLDNCHLVKGRQDALRGRAIP
jgi:hypothetical protein